MEQVDYEVLDNFDSYVLDKGGFIYVVLLKDKFVGVVVMFKMLEDIYELVKMGVSIEVQGMGIGYQFG